MTQIDDITLMAYADGELGTAEAREVEQAANDNPEVKSRLDSFRATGELLERTYAPVLEETVPDSLRKVVEQRTAGGGRWRRPKTWMAMAASLVVVVSASILSREMILRQEEIQAVESVGTSETSRILRGKAVQTAPLVSRKKSPPPKVPEPGTSFGGGSPMAPPPGMSYSAPPSRQSLRAAKRAMEQSYKAQRSLGGSYAARPTGMPPPGWQGFAPSMRRPMIERPSEPSGGHRERYQKIGENPVKRAAETPVSTFSIDVDTGAYANLRRYLEGGRLPPADAVRIEEMINYFDYAYPVPQSREVPFSVTTDMAPAFWNTDLRLLRIGLKGYQVPDEKRPAANLVFLIDVSGSMRDARKLPLLKASLKLLGTRLAEHDRISIVTYAGQARVALEPVSGKDRAAIVAVIDGLSAGGSTAGGAGLKMAYEMAAKGFIKDGINRVLLATDGDFNIGVKDVGELKKMVAAKRKSGISLSTLGFGAGNYNEALMEQVADVGDGNHAYIDSLREGRKVLVSELNSTLLTIARDVKIQVEFNPALVSEYRLVGYENRMLRREDFGNDKVDAGDLGAGHTVTALYELVLANGRGARMDPLRYEKPRTAKAGKTDELAFVRLRYKLPGEDKSHLLETPVSSSLAEKTVKDASRDLQFTGAVAAFGQVLRGGTYTGQFSYSDIVPLARGALGPDPHGYRREFAELVELARNLSATPRARSGPAGPGK